MRRNKLSVIALLLTASLLAGCGTRTGFAVAGATLLTGIVVVSAVNNENYNTENAFRPTNEIVGNLMIITALGMLLGNVVADARQAARAKQPQPSTRSAVAPGAGPAAAKT